MSDTVKNKPCVFCSNLNYGVGEHVWPKWYIRLLAQEGPFTTGMNGTPFTNKAGVVVRPDALQSVHVPVCESCNQALNTHFEVQAKPVVKRIRAHMDSSDPLVLAADDCEALARWLLKVGLLLNHPDAVNDSPHAQQALREQHFGHVPDAWIDWMPIGDAIPSEFSVYVTRRALSEETATPTSTERIWMPCLTVDGVGHRMFARSFGFTGLHATIVWHPLWEIEHPQVMNGTAVRLWPLPASVDWGALPIVHPEELIIQDYLFNIGHVDEATFSKLSATPLSVQNTWIRERGLPTLVTIQSDADVVSESSKDAE